MKEKNNLIVIQNFSSDEFLEFIAILIKEAVAKQTTELERIEEEKYLTRKETSSILQISLTCLNDWCKKGILIPLKLGNRTYFKWSDIEKKLNDSNKN